jgi:hypothetical protein
MQQFSMGGGRGRAPHDAKPNRVTNSSLYGVNFFSPSFFNRSMDGPGSFKPVANKIPKLLNSHSLSVYTEVVLSISLVSEILFLFLFRLASRPQKPWHQAPLHWFHFLALPFFASE